MVSPDRLYELYESISYLIHWKDVFRVIGVERCQQLLPYAGVPDKMANSPAGLLRAAHSFWQNLWEHNPLDVEPRWTAETYSEEVLTRHVENLLRATDSLVNKTFQLLSAEYDSSTASELHSWAERNFIDEVEIGRWQMWARMMLRLVGQSALRYPLVPTSLSPDILERVEQVVNAYVPLLYVDREEEGHVDELLNAAYAIPLSPIEQRILAMEKAYPDDPSETDVLLTLKILIQRHAAYTLWQELDTWLSESDREKLLQWGRTQAAVIGWPSESINLPVRNPHC